MSATIISTLMNIINVAQEELGKMGHASGSVSTNGSKNTKTKKVSARKGRPTAHGDFTKKIMEEHKAEADAFKVNLATTNPDQKGAHLIFVANYKKEHMDEYKAFESTWNESHPKDEAHSVSDSASVSENEAVNPEVPSKPKRVISDEQKAKMKVGREKTMAEKKAKKATEETAAHSEVEVVPIVTEIIVAAPVVAAPVVKKQAKQVKKATPVVTTPVVTAPVVTAPVVTAPVVAAPVVAAAVVPTTITIEDDEVDNEYLPFKLAGANYLRLGIKRTDNNHLWATGDLWASKKGAKGPYIGCLQENGTIDKDAEEPEIE
jgi:hypothetical protein